jgi:hypothetical protein
MKRKSTIIGVVLAVLMALAGKTFGKAVADVAEGWWKVRSAVRSQKAPPARTADDEEGNPYDAVLTGRINRPAPVASVSLETLITDYQINTFRAEERYRSSPPNRTRCLFLLDVADLCRFVDVTGRVDSMGRLEGSGPDVSAYVTLVAADGFTKVTARLPEADVLSLRDLHIGDVVTLRCLVIGSSPADIALARCGVVG